MPTVSIKIGSINICLDKDLHNDKDNLDLLKRKIIIHLVLYCVLLEVKDFIDIYTIKSVM